MVGENYTVWLPWRARVLPLKSHISFGSNSMKRKLITVETRRGAALLVLKRVMRMVPDRDKDDKRLQRLLAFRLLHDGEAATCEYLMRHIRRYIRKPEPRRFYDFLVQDQGHEMGSNGWQGLDPDPPGAA